MSRIAFIGIGAMGEPMASNLLAKGFAVSILAHHHREPVERLQRAGARIADSRKSLLADCDFVFLCLPTSREVEDVVLGSEGVLHGCARGTIVVDFSTSDPATTRKLESLLKEKGVSLIAAGLTRGVAGAKQGTLAFFVGGLESDFEKVKPVLQAMGDTFVYFGADPAHAHAAKLISNALSYATVSLVNEALMLGAKSGVDLTILHRALMEGAPSKALESFGPRMVKGEYEPPRVTVDHVCEDMAVIQALATATTAPIFGISTAQEIYRVAQSQRKGECDMSILAEQWRSDNVRK